MPPATEILDGLSTIANQASGIAMTWHIAIAMVLVALAVGWRPSERTARLLVGMPIASVAAVAIVFGNPFNGLVFAASTLALTTLAIGEGGARRFVARGATWTCTAGVTTIAFGWVYPHFLQGTPLAYLYASPVGLIPCPTLAMTIGLALLGHGLGSRAWSFTLAALGLFYGLFGVLRLGVLLDIGLVGGALALAISVLHSAGRGRLSRDSPQPSEEFQRRRPLRALALGRLCHECGAHPFGITIAPCPHVSSSRAAGWMVPLVVLAGAAMAACDDSPTAPDTPSAAIVIQDVATTATYTAPPAMVLYRSRSPYAQQPAWAPRSHGSRRRSPIAPVRPRQLSSHRQLCSEHRE